MRGAVLLTAQHPSIVIMSPTRSNSVNAGGATDGRKIVFAPGFHNSISGSKTAAAAKAENAPINPLRLSIHGLDMGLLMAV
jgi:hypothetical protein